MTGPRVAILVLGDLGRSPRMCLHALALAAEGADVELIGYRGRLPPRAVLENERIRIHFLPAPLRQRAPGPLYVPAATLDVAAQTVSLGRRLLLAAPDVLLVQNPPSLPTLPLGRLVSALRGTRLVVDWHNVAADMLALRLGRDHALVRAAETVERLLARRADAHLCVSEAMRAMLAERFGVAGARVLRDRPAWRVPPTPPDERARLGVAGDRPVVVTSSSWTDDEDFGLLADAMVALDRAGRDVLVLMTGDGPRRAHWEARFAALALRHVEPRTLWVSAEDYPKLLGSADLGVSLHRSASGVDLPMKICDMFGAGLPVCALDYGPVIRELVQPGDNGVLFSDGAGLAAHIGRLLDDAGERARLRRGAERAAALDWAGGWRAEAREVLL